MVLCGWLVMTSYCYHSDPESHSCHSDLGTIVAFVTTAAFIPLVALTTSAAVRSPVLLSVVLMQSLQNNWTDFQDVATDGDGLA
jgi:hypothetical protein